MGSLYSITTDLKRETGCFFMTPVWLGAEGGAGAVEVCGTGAEWVNLRRCRWFIVADVGEALVGFELFLGVSGVGDL